MSIVASGLQGKEQCFLWETQGTAVGQQPIDAGIRRTDAPCSKERCDFLYGIIHSAKVLYFFRNSAIFNIVLSISAW